MDPRSGERSYGLIRSKRKDPRSGERSYGLVRSKRMDPRSGERSYEKRGLDDSSPPSIVLQRASERD